MVFGPPLRQDARERYAVRPNGTECVKRCLLEGATPVFLGEQANAIFAVVGHASVKGDVGYRVEIVAMVDSGNKSIPVRSVKHLEPVASMCLLPKRIGANPPAPK